MAKSKTKQLPTFDSMEQLVDFFDNNDLGDYLDNLPEAHFDVAITHNTHLVALDQDLTDQVNKIAKARRTTSTKLINKWVRDQVVAQTK